MDMSDGSESSEADDEGDGDGDDDAKPRLPPSPPKVPEEDDTEHPTITPATLFEIPAEEITTPATATTIDGSTAEAEQELTVPPALEAPSFPPSPFLEPAKPKHEPPLTPPYHSDNESTMKAEPSILQTISKMWKQNQDAWADPFGDPEHIFRDADMVVRLDEPTSIIALALKCVFVPQCLLTSED